MTRKLGIKCTVALSDNTPQSKIKKTEQLGAKVIKLPSNRTIDVFYSRTVEGMDGTFIHPSNDPVVMAGGGTIGLEVFEELPDVDTVILPWGCGGFACGVASAFKALKPEVKIIVCEIDTSVKLANVFKKDVVLTDGRDQLVFPELVDLAHQLIDDVIVVSTKETTNTIKTMVECNCIVSEGKAAVTVAAALSGRAGTGKIACVITGGNIDTDKLVQVLQGKQPDLWG